MFTFRASHITVLALVCVTAIAWGNHRFEVTLGLPGFTGDRIVPIDNGTTGYMIGGSRRVSPSNDSHYVLSKTDPTGTLTQVKAYIDDDLSTQLPMPMKGLARTIGGAFIVVFRGPTGDPGFGTVVMKVPADLTQPRIWAIRFKMANSLNEQRVFEPNDLIVDTGDGSGNIWIVGDVPPDGEAALVKISDAGLFVLGKVYTNVLGSISSGRSIFNKGSGKVIFGHHTPGGVSKVFLMGVDANGNTTAPIWNFQPVTGTSFSSPRLNCFGINDGFLIGGTVNPTGGPRRPFLMKVLDAGTIAFNRTFSLNSVTTNVDLSVVETNLGIFLHGRGFTSTQDCAVLRTTPEGTSPVVEFLDPAGCESINDLRFMALGGPNANFAGVGTTASGIYMFKTDTAFDTPGCHQTSANASSATFNMTRTVLSGTATGRNLFQLPLTLTESLLPLDEKSLCGEKFVRGDANADGSVQTNDGVFTCNFLFGTGAPPPCMDAADANDSGDFDGVTDCTFVLTWMFSGGPPPPPPTPSLPFYSPSDCGFDPTLDNMGCASFSPCES